MSLTVSEKQLESLESRRRPVVVVRHNRTKKGYAVMPEKVYEQARPVIDMVNAQVQSSHDQQVETWTEDKNARRVALVNKKYDSALSHTEERELAALQQEVCDYQERVAPLNNHALELILEALQQRAKPAKRRKT
ncbi:MAG: hypothetical protein HZA46_00045 [Planctomycetales bacterium]|nr:hypothetical protein [Planctomycetales bacterium]